MCRGAIVAEVVMAPAGPDLLQGGCQRRSEAVVTSGKIDDVSQFTVSLTPQC